MSDDEILQIAEKCGIKFDYAWGMCFTGNVQLTKFAHAIIEAFKQKLVSEK